MNIDWSKGDGLVPAIVQDADSRQVLMLGYMTQESLAKTQHSGKVTFFSRTRRQLWTKGETSGHFLEFRSLAIDCDADTLLIQAKPIGPTCHRGTATCFDADVDMGIEAQNSSSGEKSLDFLYELAAVIDGRFAGQGGERSYVAKLIASGLDRMAQKVGEEAVETVIAAKNAALDTFENEAADLLFHLMVLLRAKNSSLAAAVNILQARHAASSGK